MKIYISEKERTCITINIPELRLERQSIVMQKWRNKNITQKRIDLINVLGGIICSNKNCLVTNRCRDIRCLQIDHIDGGGTGETRNYSKFLMYYLQNKSEAKQKLQVLCANCNWIKKHENKESRKSRIKESSWETMVINKRVIECRDITNHE